MTVNQASACQDGKASLVSASKMRREDDLVLVRNSDARKGALGSEVRWTRTSKG